jgi:hypothetical protein
MITAGIHIPAMTTIGLVTVTDLIGQGGAESRPRRSQGNLSDQGPKPPFGASVCPCWSGPLIGSN